MTFDMQYIPTVHMQDSTAGFTLKYNKLSTYRQIHRNCPQRRDPLSKWGKRFQNSSTYSPKKGVRLQNSSTYSPPKWGPPLEFINIQPPKSGSASRIHQHTGPQKGSASRIHQPKGVGLQDIINQKGGPSLDFINQKEIPSTKKRQFLWIQRYVHTLMLRQYLSPAIHFYSDCFWPYCDQELTHTTRITGYLVVGRYIEEGRQTGTQLPQAHCSSSSAPAHRRGGGSLWRDGGERKLR